MSQTTTQSESLFGRSKKVVPGGVHSPVRAFRGVGGTPRFIESAKGAYLFDVDKNKYLDFCMSWGPLLFGHQDEEVAEAVRQAMSRGWSYGATEPYSLELAEFITSRIPWVEKIRFVNSGTEAVMSAVRVARAATGRAKILKFSGCYHGHMDALLVKAGSGLAESASPDSAGVTKATAAETLVVKLNDLVALAQMIEEHKEDLALVAIEPLPANNGLLLQTKEFLAEMIRLAHKAGALVLFDEVISGFRTAFGGMAELTGLTPDLVCYGKVIGGGFPVGAYGGKKEYMDLVAPAGPVYQAGTLSANPVAMSAGLAMVKKIDRERPYAKLEKLNEKICNAFETVAKEESDIPLKMQRFSSLFWPVIGRVNTKDGIVREIGEIPEVQKEVFAKVFHGLLERGIYLAPSGFEVGFLSTCHTDEHIEFVKEKFREVLKGMRT